MSGGGWRPLNRAFVGRPGCGKTSALQELLNGHDRVLVVDPAGSFEVPNRTDVKFTRNVDAAATWLRQNRRGVLVLDMKHARMVNPKAVKDAINAICIAAAERGSRHPKSSAVLVFEEFAISLRKGANLQSEAPALMFVLANGRHVSTAVWTTAQALTQITSDIRRYTEVLYIGNLLLPEDYDQARSMSRDKDFDLAALARGIPKWKLIRYHIPSEGVAIIATDKPSKLLPLSAAAGG